jgi:hypothetical protein
MQPSSWASALKKNLPSQPSAGQNIGDAANSGLASTPDAVLAGAAATAAQPAGAALNPKAAARQKLLTEALKSRANAVTGNIPA